MVSQDKITQNILSLMFLLPVKFLKLLCNFLSECRPQVSFFFPRKIEFKKQCSDSLETESPHFGRGKAAALKGAGTVT